MPEPIEVNWTAVIGRALAYLCLRQAEKEHPDDFDGVLDRVKFLKNLGLPAADAAFAAGSTPASVAELQRLHRNRSRGGRGKKTKARRGK